MNNATEISHSLLPEPGPGPRKPDPPHPQAPARPPLHFYEAIARDLDGIIAENEDSRSTLYRCLSAFRIEALRDAALILRRNVR